LINNNIRGVVKMDAVSIPAIRLLGQRRCIRCGRTLKDTYPRGLKCPLCGLTVQIVSQGRDIEGYYAVVILRE
jgi:DNA-directed RNA polymerase subunit RPC12/RpoP